MSVIKTPIPISQGGTGADDAAEARVNLGIVDQIPVGSLNYFPNANGDSYLNGFWLKCDGSVISQATYPSLFSRVGLINNGGVNWTSRTTASTSTLLSGAYGNSIYLVSGQFGQLRASTDGVTWTSRTTGVSTNINSMIFAGGKFVYAGDNGITGTSTDGNSWTTKTPSIGQQGNTAPGNNPGPYLAYGNSRLMGAARVGGQIVTSTDGVTWNSRYANTVSNVGAVVFGNGLFVAGFDGGIVRTSTDGVTWASPSTSITTNITTMQYLNGLFIGGSSGTLNMISSTDGVIWNGLIGPNFGGNAIVALAYGAGLYLATMNVGSLASSPDLLNWTNRTISLQCNSIIFNGTLFVGGGAAGGIKTSTDGITWDTRTSNTASVINQIVFANSLHVYGTVGGGIGTSTDGITWTARTSGTTSNITALAYDGTLWHAGGCNYTLSSTDAITWTTNTSNSQTSSNINALTYGASTYVMAGAGGMLKTSTDALTWTSRTSGTTSAINAMTFGTVFAYGGDGGVLASSTDAITWNNRTSGTSQSFRSLTYGTVYVAGTQFGFLASSTDATTWTPRTSNTTSTISGLAYASGNYVMAITGGAIQSSTDAINWYSRTNPNGSPNNNLVFAGPSVFVMGAIGTVVTSPITYLYNPATSFQLPTDNNLAIVQEAPSNFQRALYIKALP